MAGTSGQSNDVRSFGASVEALKALAEPTRLRLVALLRQGDLSVKDLTIVLGQSQPRLSRHLKLLSDARWITRFPEGAWVYYRISDDALLSGLCDAAFSLVDIEDPVLADDVARLNRLKEQQRSGAEAFFQENAARWDAVQADLVPDGQVEAAILKALGSSRADRLLDIGTGTGRMLVLLQDFYANAIGIDLTHAMLQVARATLASEGVDHAQVRHGDGLALGLPAESQDLVTLHQVMHFFDDPKPLLAEAKRVLAPGGRFMIVDFGPHTIEALRAQHQHRRLGFDADEVVRWLEALDLVVEPPVTLSNVADAAGKAKELLPVHIWLARDPRVLVDAPPSNFKMARPLAEPVELA
ncbi:MAG: metalloregulator ArsR/SmtB family transcription factor [Pseudomonadota bacterium]